MSIFEFLMSIFVLMHRFGLMFDISEYFLKDFETLKNHKMWKMEECEKQKNENVVNVENRRMRNKQNQKLIK